MGPKGNIGPYLGYNRDTDPEVTNIFSTAAFRFGHFTIPSFMTKKNDSGEIVEKIKVRDGTFNPSKISKYNDIGFLLKG